MKKIIFFISLIFLCGSSAYAQSEDWRGGYEELFDKPAAANKGYNLIQLGYVSGTPINRYHWNDVTGGNGVWLSYKRGINLTKGRLPLYIEPGVDLRYVSCAVEYRYDSYSVSDGELSIPLDITYRFNVGEFGIMPLTGPQFSVDFENGDPKFKWNIGARMAYKKLTFGYHYSITCVGAGSGMHQLGIGVLF